MLKYVQRDESLRMPSIMYDDTESLLEKYLDQKKNPEKSPRRSLYRSKKTKQLKP